MDGKTWKLSRWDRSVWWKILEWARGKIPDPLAVAEPTVRALAEMQARALMKARGKDTLEEDKLRYAAEAEIYEQRGQNLLRFSLDKQLVCLDVNAPEIASLVDSMEGSTFAMQTLLAKYQPLVTEDEAFELADAIGFGKPLAPVFRTAMGQPVAPSPGETKAPVG